LQPQKNLKKKKRNMARLEFFMARRYYLYNTRKEVCRKGVGDGLFESPH
jgi:hypothetical protein